MIYLSIDIETTGLDPENNQILSIGAIIEDTKNTLPLEECPKFHAAIKRSGDITGSFFALNMNASLIGDIVNYQNSQNDETRRFVESGSGMKFYNEDEVAEEFFKFLWDHKIPQEGFSPEWILNAQMYSQGESTYPIIGSKIPKTYLNVAGKNFGTFDLKFLEKLPRWKQLFKVRSRIIDPAVLYVDWEDDESLPGLALCKERAGVEGKVTHNALEDAWDVICTLRPFYEK